MRDDLPVPTDLALLGRSAINLLLPGDVESPEPPTYRTGELAPLFFGLSLAILLPPDAIIAPVGAKEPDIQAEPLSVLGAEAVGRVLGRPTIAVSAGHVLLEQVDRRLAGMVARLNAFRVTDGPSALVSTGLVTSVHQPSGPSQGFRATPSELWELAKETMIQHGQICEPVPGLGEDAILTLRGDRTAQVAWLTDGRVATVGVTSLQADRGWVIASARAIAEHVGGQALTGPERSVGLKTLEETP